jgi:hypothetical protein
MRKISLLLMISFTSLSITACGVIRSVPFDALSQPSTNTPSDEQTLQMEVADKGTDEGVGTSNQIEVTATPTLAPTVDPLSSAKRCLANTWEIPDLSEYVIAAIPQDLAEEYDLEYQDTKGEAYITLTPEGKFTLSADNLELIFSAKAFIFEVPVTVRVDGTAVGNYDVDLTTLTISNVDTSRLSASAQALGEDLVDSDQIIKAVPFIRAPFNTAEYTCQGDTLELEFTNYSGILPALIFQAVK